MLEIYKKLYQILSHRERVLAGLVLLLMVMVALFEMAGVASIMPFIAVVANPGIVESNKVLAYIYARLEFETVDRFTFFLGVSFLVLIVGSLAFRALAFWIQFRFAAMRSYGWSCRLVAIYLGRPYEWFLNQHSGTLSSSILGEVNTAVHGALFPAMQLLSQGFVAIALIGLLIVADPLLAVSVALVLGGAYMTLFFLARKRLQSLGEGIMYANRKRYKLSQEMFGGIKDVKIKGLERAFLERFRGPSLASVEKQVIAKIVAELPSFAMQALVFGGIMIVLLYFVSNRGGLETALPVFSLYALAGYRLMPALQAIYRDLSEMRVSSAVLEKLHQELAAQVGPRGDSRPVEPQAPGDQSVLHLRNSLQLSLVSYRYPGSAMLALADLDIEIPAFSTVGLVGATGSGKTTLVDLILGLLPPTDGRICVDGRVLEGPTMRAWQRNIGYVPQQIFLADESIAANIAFGLDPDEIDPEKVERAARIADLHGFVMDELPDGYETIVGERGVRLSGGQRQRIGIARALYGDPEVLILDEATSALDNVTERSVMQAVHNLSKQKTIILIAHRLDTVRLCDRIFVLKNGSLDDSGSYDELLESSSEFQGFVRGGT